MTRPSIFQTYRAANIYLPCWDAANLVHAGSVWWWRQRCHSQHLPTRNRVDAYDDTVVLFCQLADLYRTAIEIRHVRRKTEDRRRRYSSFVFRLPSQAHGAWPSGIGISSSNNKSTTPQLCSDPRRPAEIADQRSVCLGYSHRALNRLMLMRHVCAALNCDPREWQRKG